MSNLDCFLSLLIGNFDNSEQFKDFENNGVKDFPFAEHVNTVCNNKIKNLPENFKGKFLLEESYYTSNGKTHASPHLFLFTEETRGIKLTSYEIPEGYDKKSFNYENMNLVDYSDLKISE